MAALNTRQFADRALLVPYCDGASDWSGADCWGIVELYYKHVLGIVLVDRSDISSGHEGVNLGFERTRAWSRIETPEKDCLVLMRAGGLKFGHVGVFSDGCVIHSSDKTGCLCQPIADRFIRLKTTAYLRYGCQR